MNWSGRVDLELSDGFRSDGRTLARVDVPRCGAQHIHSVDGSDWVSASGWLRRRPASGLWLGGMSSGGNPGYHQ
jgi:hypothetical protein